MRIENHGKDLTVHFQQQSRAEQPRNQEKTQVGATGALKSESGVTQAAQADRAQQQHLIELLRTGGAEVRQELVVQIQAKLHAGEYQTRAAAVEAAGEILGL